MPTGDILQCEMETHHAQKEGWNQCWCGFREYPPILPNERESELRPCRECGELYFHLNTCSLNQWKPNRSAVLYSERVPTEAGKREGEAAPNVYCAELGNNVYDAETTAVAEWTQEPPTRQGWYWHWNGDNGSAPFPLSVLRHGAGKRNCFVSLGQAGLMRSVECDEYGGWWKVLPQEAIPSTAVPQSSADYHAEVAAPPAEPAQPAAVSPSDKIPLCPAHQSIDDRGTLTLTIGGNNCVACSLAEREELLDLLAPFAPKDRSKDSVTVLRELAEFWGTHHGDNRVVVSYPAPSPAAVPVCCPGCGHQLHKPGECLNMASDNDCDCKYGATIDAAVPVCVKCGHDGKDFNTFPKAPNQCCKYIGGSGSGMCLCYCEFLPITTSHRCKVAPGATPARFKVGDRVRYKKEICGSWPEGTVTEVNEHEFRYEYDEPYVLGTRLGLATEGVVFETGFNSWELAPPIATDRPPCANCDHSDPHDKFCGTVSDCCAHIHCNCGYYSPVAAGAVAGECGPERIWLTQQTSDGYCRSSWQKEIPKLIKGEVAVEYIRADLAATAPAARETEDDLCAICHCPMQNLTIVNGIFGAHEKCLERERSDFQLAQATWDAICTETTQGGSQTSAEIIKAAFDVVRLSVTADPAAKVWERAIEISSSFSYSAMQAAMLNAGIAVDDLTWTVIAIEALKLNRAALTAEAEKETVSVIAAHCLNDWHENPSATQCPDCGMYAAEIIGNK